ncbi:hypothetical protein CKAH01_00062 [Colletotrichum kahawae]|uniref:Uncharacterized protein n=1 Tax=Colletotrichum kahawae TaxID=34407 RepID=A0AAE0DCR2_COLKA|nr:hypothetical protein CKAH01_00062 [Colletotrichum kahawae]
MQATSWCSTNRQSAPCSGILRGCDKVAQQEELKLLSRVKLAAWPPGGAGAASSAAQLAAHFNIISPAP